MSAKKTTKRTGRGAGGRKLLVLASVVGLGLAGCSSPAPSGGQAVVAPAGGAITVTPPAPKPEVIGTPPSAAYGWVPGYWIYRNERWLWVPGRWELRPHPNALWAPGHWNKTPDGWVWTPGHWD
jgi:hypothetical protein